MSDAGGHAKPGRLVLVPNTLDLGNDSVPISDVLPLGVLRRAANLQHWAAENARSTRAFLKRVHAVVPLARPLQEIQINELPRARKGSGQAISAAEWQALLAPALSGHDLGLLSEAGLPAVADPGAELVAQAHAAGLQVQTLAGPSSLLMALAASGLNGQQFAFVGYLPQEATARAQRIRELETVSRRHVQTQICIETPYRNAAVYQALLDTLQAGTRLSVSQGLTLAGATSHTGAVSQLRKSPGRVDDSAPAVFCWLAN